MILKTLVFKPEELQYLCTVCITDNNGGKIAFTIIISALVYAYSTSKKEVNLKFIIYLLILLPVLFIYIIIENYFTLNRYLFNVEKYKLARFELLINKAMIAANNKTNPLADSSLKNHLKGFDK